MHVISSENYREAEEAVRDILMLYVDLADATAGSGHAADVHIRFDPLRFVDARGDGTRNHYVDLDLLRAGSAIAVVCAIYDLWCEEQHLQGNPLVIRYEAALDGGRLSAFPDIEELLRTAFARAYLPLEDPWIEEAVGPIYRKYVLGFFRRLASADRLGG